MDSLAEQILVDIISSEMELDSERVWIRDQNRKIPNDEGLFIVLGMSDAPQFIGNTNRTIPYDDNGTERLKEVQTLQLRENIQIDIASRNNESILRRWEVLAAISSVYSIQKQEENYFKIFRIPTTFVNISEAEGGSVLNRYSIIVPCVVWYRKEKQVDSYNDFGNRVDDQDTIGTAQPLIEFTIAEE